MSASAQFTFNTAITELVDGRWKEAEHNLFVQPLRALMAKLDGFVGCHIARYGMNIDYIEEVVTLEQVTRHAKSAIEQIARDKDSKLFPMREDKHPAIVPPTPITRNAWWIVANLPTDLYVDADAEITATICKDLGARLMHVDGARDYNVTQRQVGILVDKRLADPDSVLPYLRGVVDSLLNEQPPAWFPFTEDHATVDIEYKTFSTNRHLA